MRKLFKIICAFAMFFASDNICGAQQDELGLQKIVVTTSRVQESYSEISRDMEIITSEDLEESCARDLSEALDKLSNVHISSYGDMGASKSVKMRGSNAAQVLVLFDGKPLNSPRDGQIDLSTIPLENIDHIEILNGPASHLYGSGALGGTINIITKTPPLEKQKTQIISSFGTYGSYLEKISFGARNKKFGYLLNGGYQRSLGYRENGDFNSRDWNAKLEFTPQDNQKFTLTSGYYKDKKGTPGLASSPDNDDRQQTTKNNLSLDYEFNIDPKTNINASIYNNYERLEFSENTAGSIFDTAYSKAVHSTDSLGLNLQASKYILDKYRAILGLNYTDNKNNSNSSGKHSYNVNAYYLENQIALSSVFTVNFGARLDDYSNFGCETSPSAGFIYKPNDSIKIHSFISSSFRAPTFNDLYWPDEGWIKGNENLSPEKGITGEIGVDLKLSETALLGITYYHSDYNDLINWGTEAGVWMPKNIDSALIDGIDFTGLINLTDRISLSGGYSYAYARDDKTKKLIIYQPRHKADIALKYADLKGLSVEFNSQFTDSCFYDAANTTKLKKFITFGIDISKKINDNLTWYISFDNITNRKYCAMNDYPMPGFKATSAVKLEF